MSIELQHSTDKKQVSLKELILSNILNFSNVEDFTNSPLFQFEYNNCFLIRVEGNSMVNAGICSGDQILADKTCRDFNNKIVIAEIDNKITLKRFYKSGKHIMLYPDNPDYKPIRINNSQKIKIWGVAKKVIKNCI